LTFWGVSKDLLPGYVGFFQFLRNFKDLNCFGKGEKILEAGLDPRIASAAKKGERGICLDLYLSCDGGWLKFSLDEEG